MDKKVKVAIVTTGLGVGGAEQRILRVAKGIDKSMYEVDFFCIYDENNILVPEFIANGNGVRIIKVFDYSKPFFLRVNVLSILRLAIELRARHYDIVHCQLDHANTVGRIAAIMAGIRVIIASACNMHPSTNLQTFFDRFLGKRSSLIMCVSKSVMDFDRKRTKLPKSKYRVIYSGIDTIAFSRLQVRAAKENYLNLSPRTLIVGTVGRLHKQKDLKTLMQSFKLVTDKISESLLVIVGDGPDRRALVEFSLELDIYHRVRFLGVRTDIPQVLSCFDVFVLSSIFEGFPNALLEAMAMEVPVIATDLPPIREIMEDGLNGLIVRVGRPEEIAIAIQRLHSDADLARKLSSRAKETVCAKFSVSRMTKDIQALYQDTLRLPRGRRSPTFEGR